MHDPTAELFGAFGGSDHGDRAWVENGVQEGGDGGHEGGDSGHHGNEFGRMSHPPPGLFEILPQLFDTNRGNRHNVRFRSEGFPSGQRDQTVNLTALPSKVRILPPPPAQNGAPEALSSIRVAGVAQW